MEDKSLFSSSQPQDGISEDFRRFIKDTLEDILFKGLAFDEQKRWLYRFCEKEGLDSTEFEKNMNDFIEAVGQWRQTKSKSSEHIIDMVAKECYLTEQDVEEILQGIGGGSQSQNTGDQYIEDCINEVCINGDSLSKYQKLIEKKYDKELFKKCEEFVKEVKRCARKRKINDTSKAKLQYLARQLGVGDATMKAIEDYISSRPSPVLNLLHKLGLSDEKLDVIKSRVAGYVEWNSHASQTNHEQNVLDKYPDAKFIKNPERNLIPKWFWWTIPIQLAGVLYSFGGLLILFLVLYCYRREAVKNLFMEETQDKFVRISDLCKLGIYNRRTMRIILPIEYDGIDKTDSGVYLITKGEKQGLFWKKKKMVPAEYDKITEIESGVFVVEKAGLVGAINDGKVFIPTQYDRIEIKKDGLYSAIKGSEIKYYKKDGTVSEV